MYTFTTFSFEVFSQEKKRVIEKAIKLNLIIFRIVDFVNLSTKISLFRFITNKNGAQLELIVGGYNLFEV